MADNFDAFRGSVEKQIAELRNELSRVSSSLAAKADDAQDAAIDYVDEARTQAGRVADVIRENPTTAATVLSGAGILGFGLGLIAGLALADRSSRRYW